MCENYVKKPCKNCPFRKDVKPYLHPKRGEELAYASQNPYNSFPCHLTTESSDDGDCGERVTVNTSLECAGFLTLRAVEGDMGVPRDFEPSFNLVYEDAGDMAFYYEKGNWEKGL